MTEMFCNAITVYGVRFLPKLLLCSRDYIIFGLKNPATSIITALRSERLLGLYSSNKRKKMSKYGTFLLRRNKRPAVCVPMLFRNKNAKGYLDIFY
jgi:hypothetical protein